MRLPITILLLLLATTARSQSLHEPKLLVVDSAIATITDFNDVLFPEYVLEDAQVNNKQLQYTFRVNNRPINCYYNLGREVNISDPTTKTPRFITSIVIEGTPDDLLAVYNRYFETNTSVAAEKAVTDLRSFMYHGAKYNCVFGPVKGKGDMWHIVIEAAS